MFNGQFNNQQFNQNSPVVIQGAGDFMFESMDFMSGCGSAYGITIEAMNIDDLSNIRVSSYESVNADGGRVTNRTYGNRRLSVSLNIKAQSNEILLGQIDDLKALTRTVEGTLKYKRNTNPPTWRTQKATLTSMIFERITKAQTSTVVDLEFLLTSGYFTDETIETLGYTAQTADFEALVFNKGRYETYPIIYINLRNSGNSLTGIRIINKKVGAVNGYEVEILEALGNNDLIIFNYKEEYVDVNGTKVRFYGPMTPFKELGNNILKFEFTGSVNADVDITYNKTYL